MNNAIDPVLMAGLNQSCICTLSKPMSHSARKLLNKHLILLSVKFAQKLGLTQAALIHDFVNTKFDPVLYEDAAQKYDTDSYPGSGKNIKWPSAQVLAKVGDLAAQYEYCAKLQHFADPKWIAESAIKHKPHVGNIAAEKSAVIYRWLTTAFLLNDFSDADLNKICEMGSNLFELSTIKTYALQISDPQKHSVSYLYAVARDASIKDAVTRTRRAEEDTRQRDAFVRAVAYMATPKADFKVTEEDLNSINRTSEYTRIMQEINNDKIHK